ncbi:MAG TPA: OmpH family outer membrane protein [Negativicutes bacterium]|nr:OmpH family outer membrane protein [Negativicutes bacterium]
MFRNKKNAKIVALAIAAAFLFGVAGLAVSQTTHVASAAAASNVGVVNYQMLVQQHPDMAKVQSTMQTESEAAKKEFDAKAASLGDKEKQEYYMQLQQRLQLKNQELMVPLFNKVDAVIKEVSDAKGLAVVVDKGAVIYGGSDITDECVKKISGK